MTQGSRQVGNSKKTHTEISEEWKHKGNTKQLRLIRNNETEYNSIKGQETNR